MVFINRPGEESAWRDFIFVFEEQFCQNRLVTEKWPGELRKMTLKEIHTRSYGANREARTITRELEGSSKVKSLKQEEGGYLYFTLAPLALSLSEEPTRSRGLVLTLAFVYNY